MLDRNSLVPSPSQFAGVVDHTFLKTEKEGCSFSLQQQEVKKLVHEAQEMGAFAVCVREALVKTAKELIDGSAGVKIVSVVGFPEGDAFDGAQKKELLLKAFEDGADEFDIVIPYMALKSRRLDYVYHDVFELAKLVTGEKILKVIFENCYLSEQEKELAYGIVGSALYDAASGDKEILHRRFFKTSTGFAKTSGVAIGATLSDVALMYRFTAGKIGIKPAGGVKNLEDAKHFFKAAGYPWMTPPSGVLTIDPYLFRIGSSSLLAELVHGQNGQKKEGY